MDIEEVIRKEIRKSLELYVPNIVVKTEILPYDKWLTPEEAMKVLGIKSRETLRKWTIKAKIKQNQFGQYKYSDLINIK